MHEIPDPTEPADEFDPLGDWQADLGDSATYDNTGLAGPDEYAEPSLVASDACTDLYGEHGDGLPPNDVELPDNIGELLRTATGDNGLDQDSTEKLTIPTRPDLLVRVDRVATLAEQQAAKTAGDRLRNYGVNILPSAVVADIEDPGAEVKVITKWVDGKRLDSILSPDLPAEIVDQADQSCAGMVRALADSMAQGLPYPDDVVYARQSMYGTAAGDTEPKVWVVDLPYQTINLGGPDEYEQQLLELANHAVAIENETGIRLTASREAIGNALRLTRESEVYGDGFANTINHVLESHEVVHYGQTTRLESMRSDYAPPEPPEGFELASFAPYQEQLQSISAQLDSGVGRDGIPGYIGGRPDIDGQMGYYEYETDDGRVLKVPRIEIVDRAGRVLERSRAPGGTTQEILLKPLLGGLGAEHLEQVVSYTGEAGGGIVCEKMPGVNAGEMTEAEIDRIPLEHFNELMEACRALSDRGLDNIRGRLVHDETAGFGLADYSVGPPRESLILRPDDLALTYATGPAAFVVPFDQTYSWRLLPDAAFNFYQAFRDAFGAESARTLLNRWAESNVAVPDWL